MNIPDRISADALAQLISERSPVPANSLPALQFGGHKGGVADICLVMSLLMDNAITPPSTAQVIVMIISCLQQLRANFEESKAKLDRRDQDVEAHEELTEVIATLTLAMNLLGPVADFLADSASGFRLRHLGQSLPGFHELTRQEQQGQILLSDELLADIGVSREAGTALISALLNVGH